MFRRPGKNPLEKEIATHLYPEEVQASSYKYGAKKAEMAPNGEAISSNPKTMEEKRISPLPHHFHGVAKEEPETTLGEGVTFRGELRFERLLRIDGLFEGELLSKGELIVGPKGTVKANINLNAAIIEGKVVGNITVAGRLELRQGASVEGDIKAASLSVDDGVRIIGLVEVDPTTEAKEN